METQDSFSRMATGISDEERQSILERMKISNQEEIISSVDEDLPMNDEPIQIQIKKETFLFRFYIWLKSVLTNTNIETLYNEHKIFLISRNVERNYPGIIDYRRGLFLDAFYNELTELKSCASFFRPYMSPVENSDGDFYVLLSSFVIPELTAEIEENTDPKKNAKDKEAKSEYRVSLLRKMEDLFENIDSSQKAKMYMAVKTAEWLRHFTRIPFTKFLTLFTSSANNQFTCPFDRFSEDFDQMGRILCNNLEISDELLEALHVFSLKERKIQDTDEANQEASVFLEKAHSSVQLLTTFIRNIPVRSLGCIVHNDFQWQLPFISGGEDWFVRFKNSWKKLFEQKWAVWEKECKKEFLKSNLKNNFGLDEFPLLDFRPWAEIWGGIHFRYELTAGFLNWFMKEGFLKSELVLKKLQTEGSFKRKENQTQLYESFNTLISLSISLQGLLRNLSPNGELGMVMNKLKEEHLKTLQIQTKAEQMVRKIESDVATMLHQFGEATRTINRVLAGILGKSKEPKYETITNLNKLNSKNEEDYVIQLEKTYTTFVSALDMIKNLESIDIQKTKI
ncbi:DUF5312 family protein [Treponema sp.]|uniref:DUF5312 family protein n=1 Tax=Treponema sp. TaxID=166 RepID=UPI00388D384D